MATGGEVIARRMGRSPALDSAQGPGVRPRWRSPMSGDSRFPRGKALRRTPEEITVSPRCGLYALSGRQLTAMPEVPRRIISDRDFDNSSERFLVFSPRQDLPTRSVQRESTKNKVPMLDAMSESVDCCPRERLLYRQQRRSGLLGNHPSRRDGSITTRWIAAHDPPDQARMIIDIEPPPGGPSDPRTGRLMAPVDPSFLGWSGRS